MGSTLKSAQGIMCAMTVKYSSERTTEAIIESVIKRSLADQSERHILDRGQRQGPEDNEGNICSDGQLLELSREISVLLSEVEALEVRLRLSAPTRSTSRRTREPFARRWREGGRRQGGGRTLEQQRRVEAGLERSRRRRLHRARDVIAAGNIIAELSQGRGESQEKNYQERTGEGSQMCRLVDLHKGRRGYEELGIKVVNCNIISE